MPAPSTQNEQAIFGEPGMPTEQIWQQSKVIALFGEHDEAAAVIDAAAQECGLKTWHTPAKPSKTKTGCASRNRNSTPSEFPTACGLPLLARSPEGCAVNLRLDPGLAFGDRQPPDHAPLPQMAGYATQNGESVLDYGCGSGILTIAALKLGAGCRRRGY